MEENRPTKVRIFVSYSHKDAGYLADDSMLGFLKGLESDGVEFWSDRQITAGDKWDEEIKDRLNQTDIALVLVSQWFLDSAYCINTEVSGFLKGCQQRGLIIFPIILSPCEWQAHEWLKNHHFLPGVEETIEEHYSDPGRRKRLYLKIRHDLRKQVERVRQSRSKNPKATTISNVTISSTTQSISVGRDLIQKKICMLGAFAVGKTSLVSRFVKSIYSDEYLTTVGVKVDKKTVMVGSRVVNLILWDLAGDDEAQRIQMSYLRGASGYLLVADGTRRATLDTALRLQQHVVNTYGPIPFALIINKADLTNEWDIDDDALTKLTSHGWTVIVSSAKTGQGVEEAFLTLSRKILGV